MKATTLRPHRGADARGSLMAGAYAGVELNVLLCPGCRETVSDQPPSTLRNG
jgi:hypothetical protein